MLIWASSLIPGCWRLAAVVWQRSSLKGRPQKTLWCSSRDKRVRRCPESNIILFVVEERKMFVLSIWGFRVFLVDSISGYVCSACHGFTAISRKILQGLKVWIIGLVRTGKHYKSLNHYLQKHCLSRTVFTQFNPYFESD